MSKILPIGLCIILALVGSIVWLASSHNGAQAQGSGIIVEDAEYVSANTTIYSVDLVNTAKNVAPRIVLEYGESISQLYLYKSDDLNLAASAVSPRIIIEYAEAIFEYNLQPVTVPDIVSRIIVEYSDSVFTQNLERPPAPLTSPPVTNVSLRGVLGRGGWFTSNVEVNLSANVPVEKTEYSFDNTTWITYTAPFTITSEGHNHIYYSSMDKAGNVEIAKTETVKIDKTPPLGSILINNGNVSTTSKTVTLSLNATDAISGVSQMRFSNYGAEETWTTWEAYGTQKSWVLPSGNGTKKVYVQYMDNASLFSTFSNTTILVIHVPTPVALYNPSNITMSSVQLAWSRNNDNDFFCYQIMMSYYPPPHAGYYVTKTIYDQNAVNFTVTGLQASQIYYFIIRTLNQEQEYSDSNQVYVTTRSSGTTPVTSWPPNTLLMMFVAIVSISIFGLTVRRILKRRHKPKPYTPKPISKKKDETVIYGKSAPVTVAPSVTLLSGEIRCGNCGFVNPPNMKYCKNCGASL